MKSHRLLTAGSVAAALAVCAACAASAGTRHAHVPGKAMPWVSNQTLNQQFPFGSNDGSPPIVVSLASLHAHHGSTITVTYVRGKVSAGHKLPFTDANGDQADPVNNDGGGVHGVFPSYYMSPYYPIYLAELVGAFVDTSGNIVGEPVRFANGPTTFAIPKGAKMVQFGSNDNVFADNKGAWTISVSSP